MKSMLRILREKYNSSSFDISEDESFTTLLFNDKALKNDSDFFDFVYDLAYECLPCEQQVRFAVAFDYLNEMDEINFIKLKNETFNHNIYVKKVNKPSSFHFTDYNPLILRDSLDKISNEKIMLRKSFNNWTIGKYNIMNSTNNIETKNREHFDFNKLQVHKIRNLNSKECYIH